LKLSLKKAFLKKEALGRIENERDFGEKMKNKGMLEDSTLRWILLIIFLLIVVGGLYFLLKYLGVW